MSDDHEPDDELPDDPFIVSDDQPQGAALDNARLLRLAIMNAPDVHAMLRRSREKTPLLVARCG